MNGSPISGLPMSRGRRIIPSLIAPETMGVLAGLATGLENAGARSLGCSARSIELTGNKARLADWLQAQRHRDSCVPDRRARGGACPGCELSGRAQARRWRGSVDTYWVAHAGDLPPAALAMPVALLQPFHAGVPMSASFLVAEDRAWLIGIGRQRTAIRGGRFAYQGGRGARAMRPGRTLLTRAVESVAGLRGFVGIDFLWEPELGKATVLEINPRATTSFVGLSRLLPAGRLAAAWLAACGVPGYDVRPAGESRRHRAPATPGLLRRRRHDRSGRCTRR